MILEKLSQAGIDPHFWVGIILDDYFGHPEFENLIRILDADEKRVARAAIIRRGTLHLESLSAFDRERGRELIQRALEIEI